MSYHEGDWEGMIVELNNRQNPTRATVSAHLKFREFKGGETRNWEKVKKIGDHPVVYIGKGGHPTYFDKGITDVKIYSLLNDKIKFVSGQDDHNGTDIVLVVDNDINTIQ